MSTGPTNPTPPQDPDSSEYIDRYTNEVAFRGLNWRQGTVKHVTHPTDSTMVKDKVRGHPVGTCGHPVEDLYSLYQCCVCSGISCREHSTQCAICRRFCGTCCCARELEVTVQDKKVKIAVCLHCYVEQTTPRIVKFARKTDKFIFEGGG